MAIRETIITELKVAGARAYVSAINAATYALDQADRKISRIESTAGKVGSKLDNFATRITRYATNVGMLGVATGAAAIKTGLEFNATIERSEIGIGTLVHSATRAKKIVGDVRDFALKAPLFGVEQMTSTAQQLIGAGYDAKNIVPVLRTFSDTLSAMGKRPEDIQRMTYAFSQMMQKGQISAEELRGQLAEIFPAQRLMAKEMGISSQELGKRMKEGAVKGKKPLMLLLRAMEKEYGGGTERMAKTFDGMWANIKEQTKFAMATLFHPLFVELERDVFPALGDFGSEWQKVLGDQNTTAEEKWRNTKDLFNSYIMPIWWEFKDAAKNAGIPEMVTEVMDAVVPAIAEKGATWGAEAVKAMFKGWKDADLETQLITGFLLLGKFGLLDTILSTFGRMGTAAGKKFVKTLAETTAGQEALVKLGAAGTVAGRALGKGAAIGVAAAFVYFLPDLSTELQKKLGIDKPDKATWGGFFGRTFDQLGKLKGVPGSVGDFFTGKNKSDVERLIEDERRKKGHKAGGGTILSSGPYVTGEGGPERIWLPSGARVQPTLGGELVVHNYMMMDGRVASKSIARYNADMLARR